jgi:pimeloyl-ACP methyl ester carboxylesterase
VGHMRITEGHLDTADLRVFERRAGAGDPVVFVHGFPQTSYQWRHQLAALSDAGFGCFAPDNRGFGGTDKPGARVSRSMLADDLVRYLDARGIGSCTLVGHDWGGIIAFKAAVDHPDRFTRLALLDTLCTVWSPAAVHGYWFKAEGLAEEFFATHHRRFIEVLFGGADVAAMGARPHNPWTSIPAGVRDRPAWIDDDALAHYIGAFSDPAAWAHAISYYRYALPFHEVIPDLGARHGERFRSLSEAEVAALWLHPDGLEQHPGHRHFYDYGPQDRHKTYPHPTLWLYGSYLGRVPAEPRASVPSGNPFLDQFSRYFPDLRARSVPAGHFLGEEAAEIVNQHLLAFLTGRL